jgi:hypothetical protein
LGGQAQGIFGPGGDAQAGVDRRCNRQSKSTTSSAASAMEKQEKIKKLACQVTKVINIAEKYGRYA